MIWEFLKVSAELRWTLHLSGNVSPRRIYSSGGDYA